MGWETCDQGLDRVDAHGSADVLDYRDSVSSLGQLDPQLANKGFQFRFTWGMEMTCKC